MPDKISYTEELQTMLDRTIARGNPNAQDVKALCSVIFRLNERLRNVCYRVGHLWIIP